MLEEVCDMNEIINYYKNYISIEGYTTEVNEDGHGVLRLKSDIEGEYEYNKSFKSEEELRMMMLQERVNGTDAIIDVILEGIVKHLHVVDGNVRVIDFIDKIVFLTNELQDIVYQLKHIDYDLRQELIFGK